MPRIPPTLWQRLGTALLLAGTALPTVQSRAEPGSADYLVHNFTADDGLRSDVVFSLAQDKDGYLWCATHAGLARFDGARFTVFDRETTPELRTRALYFVQSDRAGRLWIENQDHSLILRAQGRFQSVPLPDDPSGQPGQFGALAEDSHGGVWIRTRSGRAVRWTDGRKGANVAIQAPGGPAMQSWPGSGPEWYLEAAAQGKSRIGHLQEGRFIGVEDPQGIGEFDTPLLFPRHAGGLWMLEGDVRDVRQRALLPDGTISAARQLPRLSGDPLNAFLEDFSGNLWLGHREQGITRIAPDGSIREFSRKDGLLSASIRRLLLDREGNVWAATDGGGVSRFTPRRFRTLGVADGLPSEIIYSVVPAPAATGGGLWVAAHGGGVVRWRDGLGQVIRGFDPYPWAVHVAPDGRLWVGDLMAGLGSLQDDGPKRHVQGQQVDALCDDPEGSGWAGGERLVRWRTNRVDFDPGWTSRSMISSLACARDGTLWIGTLGDGLWRRIRGAFTRFGVADGLPHEEVNALHLDAEGVLWVGTTGAGLARLKGGRFTAIREADGLADRSVCGISEDGSGNFWFTSLGGIFRVTRRELEDFCDGRAARIGSQRFDTQDGLATIQGTGSSQPKIARTPDGRMWFATMHGLATADPAALARNTNLPPVVVEELRAGGQAWRTDRLAESRPVLPAGTRRVEVHYTALSLTAPGKVRFRYRLEDSGGGDAWTEAGVQRFAAFEGLGPGRHLFRVIAANNDGVWNETGASLAFTVLPHFWQTPWFQASSGGAVLGLVGWGVRFGSLRKVRRRLAALERQQAVDQERARIARDMHDDVGAALTRLTLLSSRADDELPGAGAVAALSREIVGKLDELVWTVNPRHDTTTGLVDYLCNHAESTLRPAGLALRFDIAPGVAALPVAAGRRHQLFLAFKEAVSNVVKHAGASEVLLRVRCEDGWLRVVVEDDGRGIGAGPGTPAGDGLGNMRQRLAGIGGACTLTRPPSGGTRVELGLPLGETTGS